MFPALSLWTSSQAPWTQFVLAPSVNFSDLTTSSSVKPVLVTTGPKVTILKVLNSSTQFLMLFVKKLKVAIAS